MYHTARFLTVVVVSLSTASRASFAQVEQSSFGERQLAQVLIDRADMKGIFDEDDVVYKWTVQQFESGCSGDRIHWDCSEPISGREAENQPPYRGSPAVVRVTNAKRFSGRERWLFLVFELYNIKNGRRFEELWKKAVAGEIDREKYAVQCVALEFQAMQRTMAFFACHPIPGANPKVDKLYFDYLRGTDDFDEYIKMLDSDGADAYDPRAYYGESFDAARQGWITGSWARQWKYQVGEVAD